MLPLDILKQLSSQLREQLGGGAAQAPLDELDKIVQGLVQSAVARLDLVSRREFDAQQQVLARTRARLEQLEAQLADNTAEPLSQ